MFPALLALTALAGHVLTAGPGGDYRSISEAVEAALPGDTVRVRAGVYYEHVHIDKPIVLLGDSGAVVDGGGQGTIILATAPVTIGGLTLRNSGSRLVSEDSGVMIIKAGGSVVRECTFDNVLFGIYVKQSPNVSLTGNRVRGRPLPLAQRGDGIRLWYSNGGIVSGNTLDRTRDLVIWFSNGLVVERNQVRDGRYGLHYMYSDSNTFRDNLFEGNSVGAFLMYSKHITFEQNVFAESRGTTGMGLGIKDSDHLTARNNLVIRNVVGIFLDNSPTSTGVVNHFENNVIAFNDAGVNMLPSVHSNRFAGNRFVDNIHPVEVTGAGTASENAWSGNYWSDYAGFDSDGDGTGDTPFVMGRMSDNVLAKHPELRLYELSIAGTALEMLGHVLPLLKPEPLLVDSMPAVRPDLPHTVKGAESRGARVLQASVFFWVALGAVLVSAAAGRSRKGAT